MLAKRLKINYILDPAVKGTVSIFTYGEVKPVDYMPLLETILRVNGAAMVKVGDLYRIVPVNADQSTAAAAAGQCGPEDPAGRRADDHEPDLPEVRHGGGDAQADEAVPRRGRVRQRVRAGQLLMIEDNARSMRRTMDLIALFDSDQFAGQRVRLFEVENSRPSDVQQELEQVFKAYALSRQGPGRVKFIPVDRINTIDRGGAESRHFRAGAELDREAGHRGEDQRGRASTTMCTG